MAAWTILVAYAPRGQFRADVRLFTTDAGPPFWRRVLRPRAAVPRGAVCCRRRFECRYQGSGCCVRSVSAVTAAPVGPSAGSVAIRIGSFAPLAVHAIALSQPGALDAELAGVDTGRELRRYSILQLWIFVPFSLIAVAVTARGPKART